MPGETDGARVGVVVEMPPGEGVDPHPTSRNRTSSTLKKPSKRWIECITDLLVLHSDQYTHLPAKDACVQSFGSQDE
jgi:hypothetical protein